MAELRRRVARLEPTACPEKPIVPASAPAPAQVAAPRALPQAATVTSTGLKLLNRAGALTLFIGIIFFFEYAVDNEWIGAAGRVLLGVIAGLALLVAGEWLRTRGQTIFAQGLDACGIATLYISAYAACDYYKLIGSTGAFIAFVLISAAAVQLSRWRGDPFLAAIGYMSAIAAIGLFRLIDPKIWSGNIWTWFGFLYLAGVVVLALMQAGAHSLRSMVIVSAAAAGLEAFWVVNPGHPIACVLFFLAMAALYFRPPRVAREIQETYVIGHVFVLIAGVRLLVFWFELVSSAASRRSLLSEGESVFLAVYGAGLLLSAVLRRSPVDRVLGLALLGVVICKLYFVDVWVLTRFYRISAFVALGFLLLTSSYVYSRWKQRNA
jgi:uncharacterized membrane protein